MICPKCHRSVYDCPYGGDCAEIDLIARERQAAINAELADDPEVVEGRFHGPIEPYDYPEDY